jgi:2,4-dienoyl-CoA reductase (NADPH2)
VGDEAVARRGTHSLIATNRINDPAVAEEVLARGDGDMVSMARPFLADADFVVKAAEGRAEEINTCIACNQACLDQIFTRQIASCLLNPRACHETKIVLRKAAQPKRIAVVGAGPAGLACATTAAEAGHRVTLFDAAAEIGGQFNLARRIPGKEEFAETLRYYRRIIERTGVTLCLDRHVGGDDLRGFDHVVLATGIVPRTPAIPGIDIQSPDTPTSSWADAKRDGASPSSAPAALASTSANSSPITAARTRPPTTAPSGESTPNIGSAAASR